MSAAPSIISGRYIPLQVLGRGNMGVVYRALDKLNRREVALKRVPLKVRDGRPIPARRTGSATLADQSLALAREFRLLATLRHPNIISVLDYGFDSNRQPYLIMDILDNATTITQGSTSLNTHQIVDLLLQLLSALDYLHWRGVVHHDLKPNNVLVLADG